MSTTSGDYTATYRAIGAAITTMAIITILWFYLSGVPILVGRGTE